MPRKSRDPRPPASRYTYEDACTETRRRLKVEGRGAQKAAAAAANMTAQQFSKRMAADWESGERFRVEHFGAVALWAKAPTGWPFIPWEVAEELDAARDRVRRGR